LAGCCPEARRYLPDRIARVAALHKLLDLAMGR
jgi:predicted oxidoreductase